MIIAEQHKKADMNIGGATVSDYTVALTPKTFDLISSGIYTYKERAIIREICCNAHDAHVEVGNDDPFDVHLPNRHQCWLAIRDYGPGLSYDDMINVYTGYFVSTKTDSNDFTGAFGLGSKSPFCLVDSFTVTSWHGGKKMCFSCFKDGGMPQVAMLSEEDSDEPNGLEVKLSVEYHHISKFRDEAIDVLQWFPVRPNINCPSANDALDRKQERDYYLDGDDFGFTAEYGEIIGVMGNVPYSIPGYGRYNSNLDGISGYVKIPIGTVTVDAGRENIEDTEENRSAINKLMEECKEEASVQLMKEINEEETQWEKAIKVKKLGKLAKIMGVKTKEYRVSFPEGFKRPTIEYYKKQWSGRVSTVEISYPADLFECNLYINKRGYIKRVREAVRDGHTEKAVLIDPIVAAVLNIPPKFISDPADLPKPERHYSTERRAPVKAYRYSRYGHGDGKMAIWNEQEEDFSDLTTERVYVTLDRWDCDTDVDRIYGLFSGLVALNENFVLYGLRTKFVESADFVDGNWLHFDDYVKRELEANKDHSNVVYTGSHGARMSRLADKITDTRLLDFKVKYEAYRTNNNSDVKRAMRLEGIKRDMFNLDDLYQEIVKDYPIMKESLSFVDDSHLAEIINLIHDSRN